MSVVARSFTLDTGVWVPYLRNRRFRGVVEPLVASGRVWIHSVVLLELYAGASNAQDKRAIDSIRAAAHKLQRLFHPAEADFSLAGRILAYHSRRAGRVRPRDHSHDLLIAIGAARTRSVLLTANLGDMRRWADALRRRARLRVELAVPTE